MIDETAIIHPRAEIGDGVTIGARSRVWQFASIIRDAHIGADCNIAHGACVDRAYVGDGSILGCNVLIPPGSCVGKGCFIGPNAVICNDAWPRAHKDGFDLTAFDGSRFAVVIADGASIGALALVLPGVRVGSNAMVAGGAVVTRDVPGGHLYVSKDDIRPIREEDKRRMRFSHNANWREFAA